MAGSPIDLAYLLASFAIPSLTILGKNALENLERSRLPPPPISEPPPPVVTETVAITINIVSPTPTGVVAVENLLPTVEPSLPSIKQVFPLSLPSARSAPHWSSGSETATTILIIGLVLLIIALSSLLIAWTHSRYRTTSSTLPEDQSETGNTEDGETTQGKKCRQQTNTQQSRQQAQIEDSVEPTAALERIEQLSSSCKEKDDDYALLQLELQQLHKEMEENEKQAKSKLAGQDADHELVVSAMVTEQTGLSAEIKTLKASQDNENNTRGGLKSEVAELKKQLLTQAAEHDNKEKSTTTEHQKTVSGLAAEKMKLAEALEATKKEAQDAKKSATQIQNLNEQLQQQLSAAKNDYAQKMSSITAELTQAREAARQDAEVAKEALDKQEELLAEIKTLKEEVLHKKQQTNEEKLIALVQCLRELEMDNEIDEQIKIAHATWMEMPKKQPLLAQPEELEEEIRDGVAVSYPLLPRLSAKEARVNFLRKVAYPLSKGTNPSAHVTKSNVLTASSHGVPQTDGLQSMPADSAVEADEEGENQEDDEGE